MPGDAADQAFVDGLLHVPDSMQCDIIDTLLQRESETGLTGLPAVFDRLTPIAQTRIVSNASRLFGALRACVRSSNSQTRQNALVIVRKSGNPRLAYLAGHAIHDGSPIIRTEAAATLLELVNKHCHGYAETTSILRDAVRHDNGLFKAASRTLQLLREERQYLITCLGEALQRYESHHRPEVIEAAMLMAHELEDGLFDQSTIKRGKLTHAMLEILTNSPSPRFVPFLYVAMRYPELRRKIAPMIASCRDSDFFAEFIRWHWLTRDPAIRKHLAAIRGIAWLDDGFEATFNLPEDIVAKAPAWLQCLGLPDHQKVALLKNFLIVDNPRANHAALWARVDIGTPRSTSALESILDHPDPMVRRIAKLEMDRRTRIGQHRPSRPGLKGRPTAWGNLLDRAGLSEDFQDFWENFEQVHPGQGRTAGRHACEFIPGFTTQIQLRLHSKQPADRLRAMRLIHALNVGETFKTDVFSIANDATPEIRALAASVLGSIGGETSRRILERAVSDDAPCVQAAAIDALDQMKARGRQEIVLPKTDSRDADVRAAAVRSLLKLQVAEAAEGLMHMLQDVRADHRCAALWIVDQLRLTTIRSRITNMAQCDPDRRIARIAQHVGRRLQRVKSAADQAQNAKVSS